MVRNGHVPLTSLSFSIASSTTYSDERCSSVFLYSWACEFHLQLFGRQSGIAFRSSPVLVHAVSISANEKVVTPLVFFTSKIQSRLHWRLPRYSGYFIYLSFFFVAANISSAFLFCLNLQKTATPSKACPRLPKYSLSTKASFFPPKRLMKKSRMVLKFDPYGALMINRGNRILIVFHQKHASGSIYTGAASINCLRCL